MIRERREGGENFTGTSGQITHRTGMRGDGESYIELAFLFIMYQP